MTLIKRLIKHMESFAPLKLADRSWDNVGIPSTPAKDLCLIPQCLGLLVEAPYPKPNATKVLLTIDLTRKIS